MAVAYYQRDRWAQTLEERAEELRHADDMEAALCGTVSRLEDVVSQLKLELYREYDLELD